MNKGNIFILSGLGVDQRVFSKIDFSGLKVEYVDWIPPIPKESIAAYAKRLSSQITSQNPIIVGLSFGGMVAMELVKILKVQKLILIASAKSDRELPIFFKIMGHLKLIHMIPNTLLKHHGILTDYFFGISSKDDSEMLKQILRDTDPKFLRWAVNEILNWGNKDTPANVIHIHGKKDRIIPIQNVRPTHMIENAGHFLTITHAKQIEILLKQIL